MKILIINEFGQGKIKTTDILPRLGDKIDMFYRPFPTVKEVILYPSDETLKDMKTECQNIQAIITVS